MRQRQTLLTILAVLMICASAAHFVERRAAFVDRAVAASAEEPVTLATLVPAPRPTQVTNPAPEQDAAIIPVQDMRDLIEDTDVTAVAESEVDKVLVESAVPVALVETPDTGPLPLAAPKLPADVSLPTYLPIPEPTPAARMAMTKNAIAPDPPLVEDRKINEFGLNCGVVLTASEQGGSIVNLSISAPCRANERITVQHEGLVFTASIDDLGNFHADIPALDTVADFQVTFEDGEIKSTTLDLTGADLLDRVVLQFNGNTGLQIHALEFGSSYGDEGHVWAENPRDPGKATRLGGGFLTRLGDPNLPDAYQAEVYSLATESTESGMVRLNVEAEVTQDNCGRDVAGQTIQADETGALRSVSLTLSMPDCDAVGEFLVLKNLLRDLKVAAN